MMQINLDEFTNGFTVKIFNGKRYLVNEIFETELEAMTAIQEFVNNRFEAVYYRRHHETSV